MALHSFSVMTSGSAAEIVLLVSDAGISAQHQPARLGTMRRGTSRADHAGRSRALLLELNYVKNLFDARWDASMWNDGSVTLTNPGDAAHFSRQFFELDAKEPIWITHAELVKSP